MENIEMRAKALRKRLYELYVGQKLPEDRCLPIITSIDSNLEDLEHYRQLELTNPSYPATNRNQARDALSNATLIGHQLLHQYGFSHEFVGEHTDLVKAAACLLEYLRDMADESKARSYWELRKQFES